MSSARKDEHPKYDHATTHWFWKTPTLCSWGHKQARWHFWAGKAWLPEILHFVGGCCNGPSVDPTLVAIQIITTINGHFLYGYRATSTSMDQNPVNKLKKFESLPRGKSLLLLKWRTGTQVHSGLHLLERTLVPKHWIVGRNDRMWLRSASGRLLILSVFAATLFSDIIAGKGCGKMMVEQYYKLFLNYRYS